MRLFVGAEPSDAVRDASAACASSLRQRIMRAGPGAGIRWVPPENFHLTVWFLGEVSDARAGTVLDALAPPMSAPAFDLHLAGFGAFPPSGPPRVLWIGLVHGIPELARAHDEVGERLAPWGFEPEARAYSAHLTIARMKEPLRGAARRAVRDAIAVAKCDAGSCRIEALTVFRSRTSPHGATYERLLRVPLS